MYRHIEEYSSADFYVRYRRRGRIARTYLQHVEIAYLAGFHSFAHCGKVVVKTTVESHLIFHFAALQSFFDLNYLVDVVINGLFAKDVLACLNSLY